MIRTTLTALLAFAIAAVSMLAQQSAAGMWRVEFVTPNGQVGVNMTINQTGNRLTGQVTDEYGEFPIDGRLTDQQVTIVWSVPEDGKLVEITMKGKLDGNVITGTVKLGNVGEGPLTARRVGDAGDAGVR